MQVVRPTLQKILNSARLLDKFEGKTSPSKQHYAVLGRSFEKGIRRNLHELSFLGPISEPIRSHLRPTWHFI